LKQLDTNLKKRDYWKNQVVLSKNFPGSLSEFCKMNNLSFHTFCYWRRKLNAEGPRTRPIVRRPFVEVAVEKVEPPGLNSSLPDPRWVAELIYHMQRGLR
jgi:hypothetical protein